MLLKKTPSIFYVITLVLEDLQASLKLYAAFQKLCISLLHASIRYIYDFFVVTLTPAFGAKRKINIHLK